jgi:hypothetical protein
LRISLRAAPRDPTERTKHNATTQTSKGVTSEIHIRITSDEKKNTLLIQAQKAGLTLSEYLRRCSLNKRIHSRVSDKAIARLSSLCGLQKHLLMQIKGLPHEGSASQ